MPEYHTEREAKDKWCPKVQIIILSTADALTVYTNRGETGDVRSLPKLIRCIGPACACWEEGPEIEKTDGALSEKVDSSTGRVKLVSTGRCGWKR